MTRQDKELERMLKELPELKKAVEYILTGFKPEFGNKDHIEIHKLLEEACDLRDKLNNKKGSRKPQIEKLYRNYKQTIYVWNNRKVPNYDK